MVVPYCPYYEQYKNQDRKPIVKVDDNDDHGPWAMGIASLSQKVG
jgi:hypothetical protein